MANPRRRQVKSSQPGGTNVYKLYDKAPCNVEPPSNQQTYAQHRNTVSINGNDYQHIWETPLEETMGGPVMHENPYGTACECIYPPKRELFLTKIGEEFVNPAECSIPLPAGECCTGDVNYEGRKYFVVDKDVPQMPPMPVQLPAGAACQVQPIPTRESRYSPDVLPTDGAS